MKPINGSALVKSGAVVMRAICCRTNDTIWERRPLHSVGRGRDIACCLDRVSGSRPRELLAAHRRHTAV